ncbi:MAG: Uncharacterized protein CEN89_709 [Candidatus Berkelbacteria bacterium Licking1014_7]|uniref:Type II secretion system protein GspF domain-containing protein n=1 Tax=Candidatus Berkelbacteria bacterium Licking1014_7 TaxID=2017147 RepID=A0A554LHV6_9BACT|nr:MAG: Uncharacterized protein CEN89_709 [Candidatus Berkelbacteria bacterium Licking1014_7]
MTSNLVQPDKPSPEQVEDKPSKKKKFLSTFGIGKEKDDFVENFAMLISSGMDIILALTALEKEMKSKKMKKIVNEMKLLIDSGSPIWLAMQNTNLLTDQIISLVRIGEESGRLAENLQMIVEQQQKDKMFKSRLKSAMMYPMLVLVVGGAIGLGIAWFILPRLSSLFSSMNTNLPLPTKIMMFVGNFLGKYGSMVIPLLILLALIIYYFLFVFPKTKNLGFSLVRRLPFIKDLVLQIEIGRLGYILGSLLGAGLPIGDALNSLAGATTSQNYKEFYLTLRVGISEGKSFQQILSEFKKIANLIPVSVQHMIAASEKSGKLAETFLQIGKNYEDKIEITTKNMTIILEPLLLVVVWIGVLFIALAVILPIYSMIGGL